MKCPNCGYDMPQGKYKCLRCGYECKDLTVASSDDEKNGKEESQKEKHDRDETIDIDPDNVYISRGDGGYGGGSIFDDIFGGFGGFGGGLFGSVLGDIFGGFFGEDEYENDGEIESNVWNAGNDMVEVRDVEIIDREGKAHKSRNGKINDANVHEQQEEKKPFDKLKNLKKKRREGDKK